MTTIVNSTNEISSTADEEIWPTLNEGASPVPAKEQNVTKQVVWNDVGEPIDQEDWELLGDDDDDDNKEGKEAQNNSNTTKQATPAVQVVNRKVLRHAQSSPNLHSTFDLKAVMEDDDDDDDDDDASGSFAMVSGPGSVMSMSTTFSFRDAILSPGAVTTASTEDDAAALKIRPRTRVKPRFVVKKPMKRCIKSTGDLKSLVIQEDEEIIGAGDAMEFYHRKELGVQTRKNGLKLRPDEAKRKEMIMQKKGLQRSESRG
jgi:hypothetical protein